MKIGWSAKRKRCFFLLIVIGVLMIGATPERTIYSNTSSKELKERVMRLVKNIRDLGYTPKSQDGELLAGFDRRDRAESTISEKKKVREQWIRESDAAHDSFMRQYK